MKKLAYELQGFSYWFYSLHVAIAANLQEGGMRKQFFQKPKTNERAYVIPYFQESSEVKILSGRECAIHQKAFNEFKTKYHHWRMLYDAITKNQFQLDEEGSNRALSIQRNFSGILLVGRTALAGGRREDSDRHLQAAAIRELKEEFGIVDEIEESLLERLDEKKFGTRYEVYYALELNKKIFDPQEIMARFNTRISAASEKRMIEILPIDELVEKLKQLDALDIEYINNKVRHFVEALCGYISGKVNADIPLSCRERVATHIIEYQLSRKLNSHVEAMQKFQSQMAQCAPAAMRHQLSMFQRVE
jgi:8-oxo-dGTP pyrophosphatase MutT (NUDIX family)